MTAIDRLKYYFLSVEREVSFIEAANGPDEVKLVYLRNLWRFFNSTKFNDKMKMPHMRLMKKGEAKHFNVRATWSHPGRILSVSRRLFVNMEILHRIFLHEMCHQYVSTVLNGSGAHHDKYWKKCMVDVGLKPDVYDYTPNEFYMTPEDKLLTMNQQEHLKKSSKPSKFLGRINYYLGAKDGLLH